MIKTFTQQSRTAGNIIWDRGSSSYQEQNIWKKNKITLRSNAIKKIQWNEMWCMKQTHNDEIQGKWEWNLSPEL